MLRANTNFWNNDEEEILNYSKEFDFLFKLNNTIQHKRKLEVEQINNNNYGNSALAFTDGKTVFINPDEVKSKSGHSYFNFLMLLKGLNYHELGHILYTKYGRLKGSDSYKYETELNILEDARLENIFSGKYPKAESYFKACVYGFIINRDITPKDFLLLYGRRFYLNNPDLIASYETRFKKTYGDDINKKVKAIYNKYMVTTDAHKQIELARELAELLKSANINPENPHGNEHIKGKGRKTETKEEEESNEEIKKAQAKEKTGKNQAGKPLSEQKIKELLNKLFQEQKRKTEQEIKRLMKRLNKSGFSSGGNYAGLRQIFNPDLNHKIQARKLTQFIKRLKTDLDNRTHYNLKRGRLNLRKAITNENGFKNNDFKRFVNSREGKTRLNVSVLVDSSGSMNDRQFNIAMGSAWVVAQALQETASYTRVYEFSDDFKLMKDSNDTTKTARFGRSMCSNTQPEKALKDINKKIDTDIKNGLRNNLVIVFTDGHFQQQPVNDEINKLRKRGVYCVLVKIKSYWATSNNTGYDFNKIIELTDFKGLIPVMIQIIKTIQTRIIKEVKEIIIR